MCYSLRAERIIFLEFIILVLEPVCIELPLPYQVTFADCAPAALAILDIFSQLHVADVHDELVAVADVPPSLGKVVVESCPGC